MENNEKKPTPRSELVHDVFIARWAKRFHEIDAKFGNDAAQRWANSFLNKDDIQRIADYITSGR